MSNVKLPANTWVDLYAATGIVVGVQIDVINLTPNDARLVSSVAIPVVSDDHVPVIFRAATVKNAVGAAGAWALCVGGGGVDVKES